MCPPVSAKAPCPSAPAATRFIRRLVISQLSASARRPFGEVDPLRASIVVRRKNLHAVQWVNPRDSNTSKKWKNRNGAKKGKATG